jgi:hypothetical protein
MSATTTPRIGLFAPTFDLPPRFLSELLNDQDELFSEDIAPLSEDIEVIRQTVDPIEKAQTALATLKRASIAYVRVLYLYDTLEIVENAAEALKEKKKETKAMAEGLRNTEHELLNTLNTVRSGNATRERCKGPRKRGMYVYLDPK